MIDAFDLWLLLDGVHRSGLVSTMDADEHDERCVHSEHAFYPFGDRILLDVHAHMLRFVAIFFPRDEKVDRPDISHFLTFL